MKWSDLDNDACPVARTLAIVGDRWTLLILRDGFLGATKFEEFALSVGATRHVIADRLKRLVEAGLMEKRAYSKRPTRYEYVLTKRGRELGPALIVFRDWGRKYLNVRRPAG